VKGVQVRPVPASARAKARTATISWWPCGCFSAINSRPLLSLGVIYILCIYAPTPACFLACLIVLSPVNRETNRD
jgi:hypothetical protein